LSLRSGKGNKDMTMCHGCGGVVGRDCFNPEECEQITRAMAEQSQHAAMERDQLKGELICMQNEMRSMRADIKTLCDWIHVVNSGLEPANERTAKVGDVVNKYRHR
jgi:dihydrodipicolinate synthase/N-acetylneuraminate lyase